MSGSQASGSLFVISAPSGAGKSTLVERLMQAVSGISFSASWTTRAPRVGEVDGREYHFTDVETFRRRIDEGAFLEWAEVHGNYYGTGREQTASELALGIDLLLDIDVQGAAQLRDTGVPHVSVFILPPSAEQLEERLTGRGTDDNEVIRRRLRTARDEMRRFPEFDYLLVNDDLETAAQQLIGIVLAERARRERMKTVAEGILATFEEED